MTRNAPPGGSVEDVAQVRDEWVAAVEELVNHVETWCARRNWWVHRDEKSITEDRIGAYAAPMLLIQTPSSRLVLEPVARFVFGADGLVDLAVFPSYSRVMLVRDGGEWRIKSLERPDLDRPWSEEAFEETATELATMA